MEKLFYFIEIVIIFVLLLPLSLGYDSDIKGINALTIPSFNQVKSSVSVAPPDPGNTGTEVTKSRTVFCQNFQDNPVGFPFVYKSNDTCDRAASYKVGLFFNYVSVLLVALGIAKLTGMAVNRTTRST